MLKHRKNNNQAPIESARGKLLRNTAPNISEWLVLVEEIISLRKEVEGLKRRGGGGAPQQEIEPEDCLIL